MKKWLIILFFIPILSFGQNKYIGYWKMNSTSPTDKSGLGIGTTCANMTSVQGRIDNALNSTAGNTARITLAKYSLDTTNGNAITICFWYMPVSKNTGAFQTIYANTSSGVGSKGILIRRHSNNDSIDIGCVSTLSTGAMTQRQYDGYFDDQLNKWMFGCVVFKGSSGGVTADGYIKVYKNGEIFASTISIVCGIGAYINLTKVIANFSNNNQPLIGKLDDFFIVNYEMGATEIKTTYMQGLGIVYIPFYQWNFNGGKFN